MGPQAPISMGCTSTHGGRARGFTLIELLLAIAVVAILAAIAIPSYSAYIVRGQRAAAKTGLEQMAQFLERNYTASGCYQWADAASCTAGAGTAVLPPFTSSPTDGSAATYGIQVAFPTAQSFLITATPCGAGGSCTGNANLTFTDPDCGAFTLNNTGVKKASGTLGVAGCWQR